MVLWVRASRWLGPFQTARMLERRATHRVAPTNIFSVYSSYSSNSVVMFSHYLLAFTSVPLCLCASVSLRHKQVEAIAQTVRQIRLYARAQVLYHQPIGAWRSPVARTVWVREVLGSNPGAPTASSTRVWCNGSTPPFQGVSTGSNPVTRSCPTGSIAQWSEQSAHNRLVPGSSPGGPTIIASVYACGYGRRRA